MKKRYIGDGVYADFNGFNLIITTEDGINTTNTIFLEPEVYKSLTQYVADIEREITNAKQKKLDKGFSSDSE